MSGVGALGHRIRRQLAHELEAAELHKGGEDGLAVARCRGHKRAGWCDGDSRSRRAEDSLDGLDEYRLADKVRDSLMPRDRPGGAVRLEGQAASRRHSGVPRQVVEVVRPVESARRAGHEVKLAAVDVGRRKDSTDRHEVILGIGEAVGGRFERRIGQRAADCLASLLECDHFRTVPRQASSVRLRRQEARPLQTKDRADYVRWHYLSRPVRPRKPRLAVTVCSRTVFTRRIFACFCSFEVGC